MNEDQMTLRKAIELAITTEDMGADFYQRLHRKYKDDTEMAEIFERLAKDEKIHKAQFETILKHSEDALSEHRGYEQMRWLRATAISEFFRDDAFKDTDQIEDRDEVLGRALSFEKATLQYYEALRDVIGEHPDLEKVINTEKDHVMSIVRLLPTDGKFRGLGDKF